MIKRILTAPVKPIKAISAKVSRLLPLPVVTLAVLTAVLSVAGTNITLKNDISSLNEDLEAVQVRLLRFEVTETTASASPSATPKATPSKPKVTRPATGSALR